MPNKADEDQSEAYLPNSHFDPESQEKAGGQTGIREEFWVNPLLFF